MPVGSAYAVIIILLHIYIVCRMVGHLGNRTDVLEKPFWTMTQQQNVSLTEVAVSSKL